MIRISITSLCLSFCLLLPHEIVHAQEVPADSVGQFRSPFADSAAAVPDTSSSEMSIPVPDSSQEVKQSQRRTSSVGMDTTLFYDAKMIDIPVRDRITYLIGDAVVKFKTMTLKAEKITVDWNTNMLTAEGIPDTVYRKLPGSQDSTMQIEWRGLPSLADQGEVMVGHKMIYNFKSEKGRVIQGRTNFESGYYFGESMKKVGEDVVNISHGYFTTCEKEEDPHFHFNSRRIKVIPQDKVIAKPVVLYLGHIPVAIIPFAVFPHKKGRHSGLVIPSYGQSATEGRFIRGLGYYWAPNDYFDSKLLIDYYDLSGWMLRGDMHYAIRYLLNGNVSGSFTRKDFKTGRSERRWDLLINHRQDIDPTMRLQVNGRFVSDNSFYRDFSSNFSERLNREIRSNATFSKNWTDQRMSFSANLSQTRDIETGRITQTFPQLNFTLSQRRIFEPPENNARSGRSTDNELKWYNSIYYNYSNSLYNREIKGGTGSSSLTRYLDHNVSLSMNSPQKIFGWLTLSQGFSYNERWYDRYKENEFNFETNSVETDTVSGFASKRTFSYRLSSSTNIYGMFAPKIGNVQAIRHVITPNVSFNFSPNFSENRWNYVDTFTDTLGQEITAQKFMDAVSSFAQKNISFSVKNLFQMKTNDGDKEKKFDLFTIYSSSSYNFESETFKLSPLSTSFRSTIIKNLNLNMSMTHDFYKFDKDLGRRVNSLMLFDKTKDWWKRTPFRMTNFSFSTQFRISGSKKSASASSELGGEGEDVLLNDMGEIVSADEYYDQLYVAGGNRFEPETGHSGLDIPWRASLALDFRINRNNPLRQTKTYNLNLSNFEVKLTKNWKINYNARYDLQLKKLVSHSFTFYRDMHCWEARFVWRPSGIGAPYFYFKINVKASQLRDLKWEKRGGRSSVFGY